MIREKLPKGQKQMINTGYKPISKGMACGVHQVGRGFIGDKEFITLNFKAAVSEPES